MSRTVTRILISLALLLATVGGILTTMPAAATAAPVARPAAQPTPVTAGVPRFEPAPCVYRLPADQREGETVRCGFAILPERHANPSGRTIRLPVAVYPARGATAPPSRPSCWRAAPARTRRSSRTS